MRYIALLITFLSSSVYGTINLLNDSIFPLKAIIYNAQGEKLDEFVLQVNEQYDWYYDPSSFVPNPTQTETPFTVRFICYTDPLKEEQQEAEHQELKGEYSSDTQVAVSAMVTANTCPNGNKTCQVVKKDKEGKIIDENVGLALFPN